MQTASECKQHTEDDSEYYSYVESVNLRFEKMTEYDPVFTTAAAGLYETYLGGLAPEDRQQSNCNCCRRFINSYGGLVVIDKDGSLESPLWDPADAPPRYRPGISAMKKAVLAAAVDGVFLSGTSVLGTPLSPQTVRADGSNSGPWRHFHAINCSVFKHGLLSDHQAVAEKRQDHKNVSTAMVEFNEDVVRKAVALLDSDVLYRSEKVAGPARWLLELLVAANATKNNRFRTNIVWRSVATAPAGFCHPRSSMAGTLFEDIADGLSASVVSARFAAKMASNRYQRPQAEPSEQNIAMAEKIVRKLGIQGSLQRRYARMEEVPAIWRPSVKSAAESDPSKVFSAVKAKGKPDAAATIDGGRVNVTWVKFQEKHLPSAESIELVVDYRRVGFGAIITAVDPNAPPIMQWDQDGARNPFSHYVYSSGSLGTDWGLRIGNNKVTAICFTPHMMFGAPRPNSALGVFLAVEGAREFNTPGSCIFPKNLRSELREVRSTIEAFSNATLLQGKSEASMCGLMFQESSQQFDIRVVSNGVATVFTVDRWD